MQYLDLSMMLGFFKNNQHGKFRKGLAKLFFFEKYLKRESVTITTKWNSKRKNKLPNGSKKRVKKIYKVRLCKTLNTKTKDGKALNRHEASKLKKHIIKAPKIYNNLNIDKANWTNYVSSKPFVQDASEKYTLDKVPSYYPHIYFKGDWRPIFVNLIIKESRFSFLNDEIIDINIQFYVKKKKFNFLLSDLCEKYLLTAGHEPKKVKRVKTVSYAQPDNYSKSGKLNNARNDVERLLGHIMPKASK